MDAAPSQVPTIPEIDAPTAPRQQPLSEAHLAQIQDVIQSTMTDLAALPRRRTHEEDAPVPREHPVSSAQRVAKGFGWLGALAVTVFGAGAAYTTWSDYNATDAEVADAVAPVALMAKGNKEQIQVLGEATSGLVCRGEWEDELARQEGIIEALEAEHQLALTEYFADKAARRRVGDRPIRGPGLVEKKTTLKQLRAKGYTSRCKD